MHHQYELTILMPCLNEEETIGICIKKAKDFLQKNNIEGEVLISDNGSLDSSVEIAESLGARVIKVERKGYGSAILAGIFSAKSEYIIMGDADDSYNFSELDLFLQKLRDGDELVMGNRFKGGIIKGAMPFLHRYLGNPVLSLLGKILYSVPIGDFHCGLRGFKTESIKNINLSSPGMEFASEMVILSSLSKLKISEVPTVLHPDGRTREPHLRTWVDGWRHVKILLMHNPRWLFSYTGFFFICLGSLIVLLLSFGDLTVYKNVTLGINSFFSGCMFIFLGSQLLTFDIISASLSKRLDFELDDSMGPKLLKLFSVDRFIFTAFSLMLIGISIFTYVLLHWSAVNFGELQQIYQKLSIFSLTVFIIGVQIFFSSFLIKISEKLK